MGTGKKEAARRARQSDGSSDKMGNVRTKGENFYRSAKRVKTLNMFKQGAPVRNARGDITQAAPFQKKETPKARIEPHRNWFTNTRVIGQDALSAFRTAVEERAKDPYSYLLKQNKLPMSLIRDNKDKERKDGLLQHQAKIRIEGEKFGDTFGPKAQRKRVRLNVGTLEDMASATILEHGNYQDKVNEASATNGGPGELQADAASHYIPESGELATAREPVFSKGQSKRIWNELYKVIDSSDVVIHVLDARDPLGTRCRSVEKYIKEEAPHKHLLFLLNKCDLVPTSVAAKWVKLLSREYPTLAFHASLTNSFGKGTLISLLRQFSSLHSSRKQISVGFIGYPNTGKSSIINTLRKKKVCKTAPIPGETKVWQYITLMKRIYLIDCPGIVPPSMTDSAEDILLRGVVRVENVENPAQYVPAVLEKCRRHHLERTYDVKGWGADAVASSESAPEDNIVGKPSSDKQKTQEAIRFLEALAKKGGRLLKGGEADMDGVAKMVLNDFLRGKIPWFVPPPTTEVVAKGDEAEGRDEMLGFTHKKRKRELADVGGDDEDEEQDDDEDGEQGGDDDFEGFDEDDGKEDSEDEEADTSSGDERGGVAIDKVEKAPYEPIASASTTSQHNGAVPSPVREPGAGGTHHPPASSTRRYQSPARAVHPVYEEVLRLSPRIVDDEGLYTFSDSKDNVMGFAMRSSLTWLPERPHINLSNYESKDFATVPRCQAVDVLVTFKYTDEETDENTDENADGWRYGIRATVYTRHGVTFGDIFFAFNAIASSLPRCAWDNVLELSVRWNYQSRVYHQVRA